MSRITTALIIVGCMALGAAVTYYAYSTMTQNSSTAGAQNGDTVYVHYTGKLNDGTVFDSSLGRGQPLDFVLGMGMVIRGWDEGIVGMKVGEKKVLEIPPEKAYGQQGVPNVETGGYIIPPNSPLTFDVELMKIERR